MPVEARNIINSPTGLNIAYLIGKYLPYALGMRVATFAADRISARKGWQFVQATRCNQWVVNGRIPGKEELDKIVASNFRNTAMSIYDFYRTMNNPSASLKLIEPHPAAIELVKRPRYDKRGLIVAGIHMSNFDMVFQMGGLAGVKALVITLQELNTAYEKQLEMRKKSGLEIMPASFGSVRQAVEHLCAGGMVITAMDRPDENSSYRPEFFGLPAAMPIHHIFLALRSNAQIIVAAVLKKPDGKYHFMFSDPIEMQHYPQRHDEIVRNAENVLKVAENFIRQDSSQWAMTFPVWPEVNSQVPV